MSSNYKLFENWNDALKCSTTGAYENKKLCELVVRKTENLRQNFLDKICQLTVSEIQTLSMFGIAIAQIGGGKKINVIDYGGASGAHYFLVKHFYNNVKFDWKIVETQTMVNAAHDLSSNELSFHTDFSESLEIDEIDLIHSSGTLQCIENPYEVLSKFVELSPKFMILSKLGLSREKDDVIVVHEHMMSANGPGEAPSGFINEKCSYPFTFPVKTKVMDLILPTYEIIFKNEEASGILPVEHVCLEGESYFLKEAY